MLLSQLLQFDNIIIQCHNNPDADALASGMALSYYLKMNDKNHKFIYGGKFKLQKSNLILMMSELGISAEYVSTQDELAELLGLEVGKVPELLVTVDCQPGESNVVTFSAENIAVIDHHQITGNLPMLSEVRPTQASCSTVVWDMLRTEGIDANTDIQLATALYYGLMTDSGNFTELHHPLDLDMRDDLKISPSSITRFKNSNISQDELKIAGSALLNYSYNEEHRFAIVRTDPCDPNILGLISDMLLEVDSVDSCLVYSILDFGIKVSVRSCIKEIKANELAEFICEGVGDGGGHLVKAGGFIQRELFEKIYESYSAEKIALVFSEGMLNYYRGTDIIYTEDYVADISTMESYYKKKFELGYVKATDMFDVGNTVTVRTLEGDVDITIDEDIYIMIGIKGEIYPISKSRFHEGYSTSDKPYVFPGEYAPTIRDYLNGEVVDILPFALSCISTGTKKIYARKLDKRTKVFTEWDKEKYYLGKPSDYLAADENNPSDVYIIEKSIFEKTYEKA